MGYLFMGVVYRNKWLSIERIRVRNRGRDYHLYRVVRSDYAAVLPILGGGRVALERIYRGVIGRYQYEIPAGMIEPGESPLNAARRELIEETGYSAGSLRFLTKLAVSPGTSTVHAHIYIATGLKAGNRAPEKNEDITVHVMPISKALRMVKERKIVDMKTVAALMHYAQFSSGNRHGGSKGF